MKLLASLGLLLLLLSSSQSVPDVDYVPITFRQVSGPRPFINIKLNGVPLLLMVHANASFYAMTTHANAAKAGIDSLGPARKYGITATGQVSTLGRSSTRARTLQIGRDVVHQAPLEVFEVPQVVPIDGMLGIGWLQQRRVLVDYAQARVGVSPSPAAAEDTRKRLLAAGYVAHPMTWNGPKQVYTVPLTINKAAATFEVSTVSETVIDSVFARRAQLALGPVVFDYGGPTGTTGHVRNTAKPVRMRFGQQVGQPIVAQVYDTYAYEAKPRPANEAELLSGSLGCDFMLANKAVIDFGAGILFLRGSK